MDQSSKIEIKIDEAIPGMVLAEHIVSKQGQLLANVEAVLNSHLINHLKFYGIQKLYVHETPKDSSDPKSETTYEFDVSVYDTQSEKIKHSKEYIQFLENYQQQMDFFENSLTDFIKKQEPLECTKLLSNTKELFHNSSTTIGILDILHNMRSIDDSTYAHSMNVALISRVLGSWLNYSEEDLDTLTLAGLLHDVGKAQISPEIMQKPARLTADEYEVIQQHSKFGFDMLRNQKDINENICYAALMHHERCDGSGYPLGLTTEQINPVAMIVAIADVYDAMTADRCYRSGICPFDVVADFQKNGLNKFHPQYLLIFLERIANTYIHCDVLLSDGRKGKIVLIHSDMLGKPLVQLSATEFVDLKDHPNISIEKIL